MARMRALVFSTLLVFTLFSAGCGLEPTCADCGPCGFAGPVANPGHDIDVLETGVTSGGVAAVDLQLEDGACNGDDRKKFLVAYDAGAVTVSAADAATMLDTTKVTTQDDTSTWTDRDLKLSLTRSATTLVLAFTAAGKTVTVNCTGANHAITCAPM